MLELPRLHRRMVGWLRQRLPDAALGAVADPRCARRVTWPMRRLLTTIVTAMATGRRGLRQVESLTKEASLDALRALDLRRALPDTTQRDLLVKLDPHELRAALHRQVLRAHRRHALDADGLPSGVVSMDGKATTIDAWDSPYVQRQGSHGVIRTVTATLVSSRVRVCLDAYPIPAKTNEMGIFKDALDALVDTYGGTALLQVVMYDAGACSQANARHTRKRKLHYVMVLNEGQKTLYAEARRVLGALDESRGHKVEMTDEHRTVHYTLWLTNELAGWLDWDHLVTVVRIRREVLGPDGRPTQTGERYFVSSLGSQAFVPIRWARLLRARWGVENNCHHTFDQEFAEDARTWIKRSAPGALNVVLLRRIAYNLVALFRGRTLRGEDGVPPAWGDLMRWAYNALIAATASTVAGLRAPRPAT